MVLKKRNGFMEMLRRCKLRKEPENDHEDSNDGKNEDSYITYEDTTRDRAHFSENSYGGFERYCQSRCRDECESRLGEVKTDIYIAEYEIRRLEEELPKRKQVLEEKKCNLLKLEEEAAIFCQEVDGRIEAEWQAIRDTRSVIDVRYDGFFKQLEFDVEVRASYDGEIYDFGDYTIRFGHDMDEIRCFRIRSGVRDDWKRGEGPDYYCYSDNCFRLGKYRGLIDRYLRYGESHKAVMTTIERLHSVKDEDLEKIPKCFRKVVPKKGENEI